LFHYHSLFHQLSFLPSVLSHDISAIATHMCWFFIEILA
jgi:hypothetical protein